MKTVKFLIGALIISAATLTSCEDNDVIEQIEKERKIQENVIPNINDNREGPRKPFKLEDIRPLNDDF